MFMGSKGEKQPCVAVLPVCRCSSLVPAGHLSLCTKLPPPRWHLHCSGVFSFLLLLVVAEERGDLSVWLSTCGQTAKQGHGAAFGLCSFLVWLCKLWAELLKNHLSSCSLDCPSDSHPSLPCAHTAGDPPPRDAGEPQQLCSAALLFWRRNFGPCRISASCDQFRISCSSAMNLRPEGTFRSHNQAPESH